MLLISFTLTHENIVIVGRVGWSIHSSLYVRSVCTGVFLNRNAKVGASAVLSIFVSKFWKNYEVSAFGATISTRCC